MRNTAFQRRRLSASILAFILVPTISYSGTPAADEALRQTWAEIQTHRHREVREKWWRQVSAAGLEAFIRAGVDVNSADRRNWTPLHSAARYSADPQLLSILLRTGAHVNAQDRSGDTPLHWAAADNSNVAIVNALIDAGANVNAVDKFGWLPIHTAAERSENPEIIRALMEAGSKRGRRAYFLLFSPAFLLKHNRNMSELDKDAARKYMDAKRN